MTRSGGWAERGGRVAVARLVPMHARGEPRRRTAWAVAGLLAGLLSLGIGLGAAGMVGLAAWKRSLVPRVLVAHIDVEILVRGPESKPITAMVRRPVPSLPAMGGLTAAVLLGAAGMVITRRDANSPRTTRLVLLARRCAAGGLVASSLLFVLAWAQFCYQIFSAGPKP